MQLKVIKPFDWAHNNVRVESFGKDQVIETDDEDLIRVSLEEKWTTKKRSIEPGGKPSAPENKVLSDADENKSDPESAGEATKSPAASESAADPQSSES